MVTNQTTVASVGGAGFGIGVATLATSVALTLAMSVAGTCYYFRDHTSPKNLERVLKQKTQAMNEEITSLKQECSKVLAKKNALEKEVSELTDQIEKIKAECEKRVIHANPDLSAKLAVKENELSQEKLKLERITRELIQKVNAAYQEDPDIQSSRKGKRDKKFVLGSDNERVYFGNSAELRKQGISG